MSLGENYFGTIIKRSIILMIMISAVILFIFKEPKPYLYGIVFGSIINMLNFRLLYLSIKKVTTLDIRGAQSHAVISYMVRYLIYGIVLAIAAKADYLSLYTVVLGFFIVKIVILSDAFYDTIFYNRKNKK